MQATQMDVKEHSYFAGNQWRKAADNLHDSAAIRREKKVEV
jgi:hypothetical protein